MRVRSLLAAAFLFAGATAIAVAALQMRPSPTSPAEAQLAVNENSAGRLQAPPDLPIVEVEEAW